MASFRCVTLIYILYYWITIMGYYAFMGKQQCNVVAGHGGVHFYYFLYCFAVHMHHI